MQIQAMFRALMAEVPRRKKIRVLRGMITDWDTLYEQNKNALNEMI